MADPRALTWAVTGSGLGVGLPLLLLTTDHHAAPATATPAGDGPARGSHEEDAVDAWCRRTGVTRVASPRELADTAALLVHQPPPQGRRVAILANGDPNGNADADAVRDLCTGYGLLPPDLTQHTDARLRLLLPASASVGAVVDATAAASPEQLRLTLDALAEDPGVDAVVAMLEPRFHLGTSTIQAMLEEVSAGHARTTFIGGLPLRRGRTSRRVPFADAPDGAVRALAHAIDRQPARRRGRFLAEPAGPPLGLSHRLADLVVADARASSPDGGWLPRHEADELLRAYGVEVVPTVGADGPETAADAAQMLPFPVVLTAHLTQQPADPQPVAVVTGLRSPEEVREAARRVRDRLDDDLHVFDLQPQLHQGPCLRVMGDRREGWGPMVGVGTAGGSRVAGARGAAGHRRPVGGAPRRPAPVGAGPGGAGRGDRAGPGGADGLWAHGPDAVVRGRDRAAGVAHRAGVGAAGGGARDRRRGAGPGRPRRRAGPGGAGTGASRAADPPGCGAAPAPDAGGGPRPVLLSWALPPGCRGA